MSFSEYNKKRQKDWFCDECNKTFKTRVEYRQHRKEVKHKSAHSRPSINWTCEYCGCERFSPKGSQTLHMKYCLANPNHIQCIGHKVLEETKNKISKGMVLVHKEGRANEWQGRRERSYAEQSWYNIFTKDFGEGSFANNYFVKKYWLDFAWPEKKLYFEVDGRTHFTEEGLLHDKERTEFLISEGWTLIGRCNWSEYQKLSKEDKESFVRAIENKILAVNPNG